MDVMMYLIPLALVMGAMSLMAFFWTIKSGQYEDMEGEARRILIEDEDDLVRNSEDKPEPPPAASSPPPAV